MIKPRVVVLTGALVAGGALGWLVASPAAQTPGKVDFVRDVQPIFQQSCIGCHGAAQQQKGFRLDIRRDAMRGGTIAVIGPGNADGSRLYQRLIGTAFGNQMPPTGALSAEKIAVIKAWIDQGAEWPDAASGEAPLPPVDAVTARLVAAIRAGDDAAERAIVSRDPGALNRRASGGSTPLMVAALERDAATVHRLLDAGADVNARNDEGATALMWAVPDLQKTRLLLEYGADADAPSNLHRTPLMKAAGYRGARDVVSLLVDYGANPSARAFDGSAPLIEASYAGDAATIELLLARGATPAPFALYFTLQNECGRCTELLLAKLTSEQLNHVIPEVLGPPGDDARHIAVLVERGADPNIRNQDDRTPLMLAAASDSVPPDVVSTLLARGADVNATNAAGETALGFAQQRGATVIVDMLRTAGARPASPAAVSASRASAPAPAAFSPASSAAAALQRSLPLLQQNDVTFLKKAGCMSCHNNTLTAMTTRAARAAGLAVDRGVADGQRRAIASYLDSWRERALQGMGIPGDSDTMAAILVGLADAGHERDAATDAATRYILERQMADGRWRIQAHRPPIESSDMQVTAISLRAIQTYPPAGDRTDAQRAVRRAAAWLAAATPVSNEDRAYQLLGLHWSGTGADTIRVRGRELIALQHADGGWSQLPTLPGDAYATGETLVALFESGALAPTDAVARKGLDFLLKTQLADGSWFVKTRALRIQPHFESGFPHGKDQFISAAATNWASTALAYAVRGRT